MRPHPQNVSGYMADPSWIPRLKALGGYKVVVDFPDMVSSKLPWSMQQKDMERLSAMLAGSTVCINSGSTLSIDALMTSTPVILTSFDGNDSINYWKSARRLNDFPHLKKLIELNGVIVVRNYDELLARIKSIYLSEDIDNNSIANSVWMECGDDAGNATMSVINTLPNF